MAQFASAKPSVLNPPPPSSIAEARKIVAAMRANPRGPYDSIRWFCNDGSILPARPYGCAELGGGKQHALFSAQRERLAQLGWRVGTIFASFDELAPESIAVARPHLRLRELPLERYLVDIDDGWVLHKARGYRGRVQIEDEQRAGLEILLNLLKQNDWKSEHFILARELTRTIPHNQDSVDPTRNIRRQSQLLAELERSFEPLRAEIHGHPTRATAKRIRLWMSEKSDSSAQIMGLAEELAVEMEDLYSVKGSARRLQTLADTLRKHDPGVSETITAASQTGNSVQRLSLLAEAVTALRSAIQASDSARINLRRLNLMTELEAELLAVSRVAAAPVTRGDALRRAAQLLQATRDLGWLSDNELLALVEPLNTTLSQGDNLGAEDYRKLIRRLQLAPAWAQASIRHTFAEALAAYSALDPRAAQFVDDLLRGSALMPLAEVTHRLLLDSGRITGKTSSLFGQAQESVWGLNPGVAQGKLRVLAVAEDLDGHNFDPADIVVIPNTTSSLFPAAGIVTIGEGNPLSHIQILARNLGIPNIVIGESLLPLLQQHDGARVELAAAADGRVLLRLAAPSDTNLERAVAQQRDAEKVLAPVPDLRVNKPLPLAQLNAGLSGRVVGPKAANVGELARLFPDRIAPAVALPFGVFAEHTGGAATSPRLRVKQAFARFDSGSLSEAEFLAELDKARAETAAITLQPTTRQQLAEAMEKEFGSAGGVGVFVRSDTNMEDLPQFTGAGLNETVPNVIGFEQQMAAISQVWSSVYSRRAMAWRSRILKNPDDVFSSVLLMQSVPSDKSGVLVTTDLTNDGGSGFTVSLSWGIGGAVDNESAASYLLKADGQDLLLAEAKAPYQRYLKAEGGVGWRAAASGGILNPQETAELRALAREVIDKYPPSYDAEGQALPWDIEFAFAGGKLMLLQIRPLVQRGAQAADKIVSAIIPQRSPDGILRLSDKLAE
ncbi:hypothetical protein G8764_05660 [Pseudomaricurvus alcaniphilus]|uniref:PEP/pyruvate-binding domain-containing protein n=1 Tax=Pseudomaricurvus alcaniphilus TaxID=1166482 RepID=UPI00140AE5E4|nr:hypothetical protein [Pseudomaricurvus alcaniphilus]